MKNKLVSMVVAAGMTVLATAAWAAQETQVERVQAALDAWLAARVQPSHGSGRQQECTDYLGRAAHWRAVPRRLLKACLRVCETTEK